MSRKIGAQKAINKWRNSALNGFNRILATFNKDDDENYRGYYFALNNHEGDPDLLAMNNGTGKRERQTFSAPCKSYALIPALACQQWPRNIQITSGSSQRNDGKAPINSSTG